MRKSTKPPHDPLSGFLAPVARWFRQNLGEPTDIQRLAWEKCSAGEHFLAIAPTGSGKTLAAFLWWLQEGLRGNLPENSVSLLYISPLKALNNDIKKNLSRPLYELKEEFRRDGLIPKEVTVAVRSGDTGADERRAMLRSPPHIFVTTPESLNILLATKNAFHLFSSLKVVILDEIHAVLGSKRGVYLISAVERLTRIAGEFQRIALSATVTPPTLAADFIGGYRHVGGGQDSWEKRSVAILQSGLTKKYSVGIRLVEPPADDPDGEGWWKELSADLRKRMLAVRSALVFTNSRRLSEKIARYVNEPLGETLAYAHHGSLSREIRFAIEDRMKKGELKGIIATSSLELGIDIGDLDRVMLVQTPFSIASAMQRLGRSGHSVGLESRGILFPSHARDLLMSVALAGSIRDSAIEPTKPVKNPLDILAQLLLSMCCTETWQLDSLYLFVKSIYAFHDLPRILFDLVIEMLAGRYADSRIRELVPRVHLDSVAGTVKSRDGVAFILFTSGGTIPDRGLFILRHRETGAKIGELDEEFVWERKVGDSFALGNQIWRITDIGTNDVTALPLQSAPGMIPFWKTDSSGRPFPFCERTGLLLERGRDEVEAEILSLFGSPKGNPEGIEAEESDGAAIAARVVAFMKRQEELTDRDVPHRHHVLVESVKDPLHVTGERQVVIHLSFGKPVNMPFSMLFSALWEETYGMELSPIVTDDAVAFMAPWEMEVVPVVRKTAECDLHAVIRKRLEHTGFFGARFRENAGRALLLPKLSINTRTPLWLTRQKAKKLLSAVSRYDNFPIVAETWRTCLQDEFDLEALKIVLDEILTGTIAIDEAVTPYHSPFAADLVWNQTNELMYADDTPYGKSGSRLSDEIIREVADDPGLRPVIPVELVVELEGKLQRTFPGYAPSGTEGLVSWGTERLFLTAPERDELVKAWIRDGNETDSELDPAVLSSLKKEANDSFSPFRFSENGGNLYVTADASAILHRRLSKKNENAEVTGNELAEIADEWLAWYGPMPLSRFGAVFGLDAPALAAIVDQLVSSGSVVAGLLTLTATEAELCNRDNYERLLLQLRRRRNKVFPPVPAIDYQYHLATMHGLTGDKSGIDGLQEILDRLAGYPLPVRLWEEVVFPSRLHPYYTYWLDSLFQTTGLSWLGAGKERVTFYPGAESELYVAPGGIRDGSAFSPPRTTVMSAGEVEKVWQACWRGILSHDGFDILRKGVLSAFDPFRAPFATLVVGDMEPATVSSEDSMKRRPRDRWAPKQGISGSWRLVENDAENAGINASVAYSSDPIYDASLKRDRIRQLLRRFGIVWKALLEKETKLFQWGELFRELRTMELSGEIVSGFFIDGVPGIQFASPGELTKLHAEMKKRNDRTERTMQNPDGKIWWINAADPASLVGAGVNGIGDIPSQLPRLNSEWLVFDGTVLLLCAKRNGRDSRFFVDPGDLRLERILRFYRIFLERAFNPLPFVRVETINDEPAAQSAFRGPFLAAGFTAEYRWLELSRGG